MLKSCAVVEGHVRREDLGHRLDLLEDGAHLPEELLLAVHHLGALLGLGDLALERRDRGQFSLMRSISPYLANSSAWRTYSSSSSMKRSFFIVSSSSTVTLRLEPLVALGDLELDLAQPAPRVADRLQLLRLEADRLLDEEAQRLARLVELAVERREQAGALAEEGLERDHLLLGRRVDAEAHEDLHVARAELGALGGELALDLQPQPLAHLVRARHELRADRRTDGEQREAHLGLRLLVGLLLRLVVLGDLGGELRERVARAVEVGDLLVRLRRQQVLERRERCACPRCACGCP